MYYFDTPGGGKNSSFSKCWCLYNCCLTIVIAVLGWLFYFSLLLFYSSVLSSSTLFYSWGESGTATDCDWWNLSHQLLQGATKDNQQRTISFPQQSNFWTLTPPCLNTIVLPIDRLNAHSTLSLTAAGIF